MTIEMTTILVGEEEPMQPVGIDANGTHRFLENRIVRDLLDTHPVIDMNEIAGAAACGHYSQSEQRQFAQLIGYSVSGYGNLSYVTPESCERADALSEELFNDSKES